MIVAVCVRAGRDGELNPFDACALEAALRLNAETVLVSMAPAGDEELLRRLTRLGAKEAYLLSDPAFAGSDTVATTRILARFLQKLSPEMILCGRKTVQGDTGQVGPGLAARLNFAYLSGAMNVEADETGVTVTNRAGEKHRASFPALVTVERFCTLRLPGIRSRIGNVTGLSRTDLGLAEEECGLAGSPTRVVSSTENDRDRRKSRTVELNDLPRVLRESLGQNRQSAPTDFEGTRLREIWCVGESVREIAACVAETVHVVPPDDAALEELMRRPPAYLLWGNDEWSRQSAATWSVRLETGLCADCTGFVSDGKELYMVRPACAGNVMATIACRTRPAMATVPTKEKSAVPVTLTLGLGAMAHRDEWLALAEKNGWDVGATRAAVDHGFLPYERQIGLTGRTVSPRVYLAVGLSGAVHHIAGMKTAGTVIAVNSDPRAPIFDYADVRVIAGEADALAVLQKNT